MIYLNFGEKSILVLTNEDVREIARDIFSGAVITPDGKLLVEIIEESSQDLLNSKLQKLLGLSNEEVKKTDPVRFPISEPDEGLCDKIVDLIRTAKQGGKQNGEHVN